MSTYRNPRKPAKPVIWNHGMRSTPPISPQVHFQDHQFDRKLDGRNVKDYLVPDSISPETAAVVYGDKSLSGKLGALLGGVFLEAAFRVG